MPSALLPSFNSNCDGQKLILRLTLRSSKTDLVPPLPVTRSSDAQGSGGPTVRQVGDNRGLGRWRTDGNFEKCFSESSFGR